MITSSQLMFVIVVLVLGGAVFGVLAWELFWFLVRHLHFTWVIAR